MFLLAFHNPLPHRAPLHFPLFLLWGIKVRELVLVDNHRHQDRKDDSKDTPTVSWGVIFDPRPTSGTDNSHFGCFFCFRSESRQISTCAVVHCVLLYFPFSETGMLCLCRRVLVLVVFVLFVLVEPGATLSTSEPQTVSSSSSSSSSSSIATGPIVNHPSHTIPGDEHTLEESPASVPAKRKGKPLPSPCHTNTIYDKLVNREPFAIYVAGAPMQHSNQPKMSASSIFLLLLLLLSLLVFACWHCLTSSLSPSSSPFSSSSSSSSSLWLPPDSCHFVFAF